MHTQKGVYVIWFFGTLFANWGGGAVAAPPVRVWGDLSTTYRWTTSETLQQNEIRKLAALKLNGLSYIWRPWFALVSGVGSFTVDNTKTTNIPSETSQFTSGNARVNMFPKSRFPLNAYVEKSDSRDEYENMKDNYSMFRYGLLQQYRNIGNDLNVLAKFDESSQQRSNDSGAVTKNVQISASKHIGAHELALSASGNTTSENKGGGSTDAYAVTGRHAYSETENFSVETLTNKTGYSDQNELSKNQQFISQLSSVASWRPKSVEDLSLSGSFRFQQTDSGGGGFAGDNNKNKKNKVLNALVGTQYELTPQVSINGNVNTNKTVNGDTDNYLLSETLGASYHPDIKPLKNYTYSASLGGSVTNLSTGSGHSQQIVSSANHTLSRNIKFEGQRSLVISVNEGINTDNNFSKEPNQTLNHTFSVDWNLGGADASSLARFLLSESRELSTTNIFQLVNFQYTQKKTVNRNSSIFGNLTLQGSRQLNTGGQDKTIVTSGLVQYQYSSLFRVPMLNLSAELKLRSDALSPKGDALIDGDRTEEALLKTELNYRIGMLFTQFSAGIQSANGAIDRSVQLKISRVFGY